MALYMGCNRCRNLGNFRNNGNEMENIYLCNKIQSIERGSTFLKQD